ncbi:hypothetical protein ACNTMW_02265 [Planosporangium sp. 12N6]|uniref:hypothetical protein n=1 Tax=Planosporangium spinosum TaxID=3402278 RepID=UPI003CF1D7E5
MTTKDVPATPRYAGWRNPSWVALLGTVVVAILLILPVSTFGPGDHEKKSCGNALKLDLDQWRRPGAQEYWDSAYRACTSERVDRVAQAVGVESVTVLIVTVMAARTRRRSSSDGSRP